MFLPVGPGGALFFLCLVFGAQFAGR
jgi:hypothetical protein